MHLRNSFSVDVKLLHPLFIRRGHAVLRRSLLKRVKLAVVFSNLVQAPKAMNLVGGEGAAGDDFTGESHVVLGDGVSGSDGEAGGSGHHRAMVTHDALPYLTCQLPQVRNRDKHGVCSSEIDVWVFGGLDTQNTQETLF
jgi:hypothetical protein